MLSHFATPDIQHTITHYSYLAVALGIGIESLGIPFPGETVLVAASIYAGTGHLSIFWVITASTIGAITGDNLGYLIGRHGGYRILLRFGRYIRIYPQHLTHAKNYFHKHGGKTVFFGRFVSLLRMWAALLAGINKMEWKRFLVYNAAGGIVWSVFYGLLGYFLGKNLALLTTILHTIGIIGLCIVGILAVAAIMTWKRVLPDSKK
jgi:membrane protein DedA with SNARE-associated domain